MVQSRLPSAGQNSIHLILHSRYLTHFHIYTDGSCLTTSPSVGTSIYIPSRSLATAWRLLATASITTAELFTIKEGLQFATTLAAPCSIALFSDSLSALQIVQSHRPHSHHLFLLGLTLRLSLLVQLHCLPHVLIRLLRLLPLLVRLLSA
ncbi:hypothetical protein E2C01_092287 [Portunus trituberculatus]|uniref:RNase H type-1 domain-containing protein n=1 Tax=Portunus trituberculatus TaxID=210409 RepID=A0A5B7JJP8_PORTR|nr:hypothetical protein [Portunus trituberculatus]